MFPKRPTRFNICPSCQQRTLRLKHRIEAYFGSTTCTNCGTKLKLSRAPAIFLSVVFAFIQLPVAFTLWLLLAVVFSQWTALIAAIGICVALIEGPALLIAKFKPA